MDSSDIIAFIKELTFLLCTFGFFLGYSIFRGRQAVINLLVGLYFALLISVEFPYYESFLSVTDDAATKSVGLIVIFLIFTIVSTLLMSRLMPDEYQEGKFESFGKKLLLAIGGTILVMVFSFHVLPVTEFLTPGTPIQALFAPAQYFFWWLLVPLVVLYIN